MERWLKCPADIFPGRDGYSSLQLRSDVAGAYSDLYTAVHALGGILTTAGGKRSLSVIPNQNQSKTSFHYIGRAFDMSLPTGMQDPEKDPYVILDVGDRLWDVYCKSTLSSDALMEKCRTYNITGGYTIIDGTYNQNKKILTKQVSGNMFSFTELAKTFGFERIAARKSFFNGNNYVGAEWWHFQWETGLVPQTTTFGNELLRTYTLKQCQQFPYWESIKGARFQAEWL
jgi:hypothetical protein